jgi:glycosyltransferase involved in cell wall biosynthesis
MNSKEKNLSVSIIMPVYNSQAYLKRVIESILVQTYTNFELIIVDDGSTDDSLNICKGYATSDKRLRVISQKNKGVSVSRNIGISKSKGALVTFVDSDDWLEINAIEQMVEIIRSFDVDSVRTNYQKTVDRKLSISSDLKHNGKYERNQIYKIIDYVLYEEIPAYTFLLMIKKDILETNMIRFITGITMMEDVCFYIDLLNSVESIYISNQVTYNYYINEAGASRSPGKFKKNAVDIMSVNKILCQSVKSKQIPSLNAVHAKIITTSLMTIFRLSIGSIGSTVEAAKYLRSNDAYTRLVGESELKTLSYSVQLTIWAVIEGKYTILLTILSVKYFSDTLKKYNKIIGIK